MARVRLDCSATSPQRLPLSTGTPLSQGSAPGRPAAAATLSASVHQAREPDRKLCANQFTQEAFSRFLLHLYALELHVAILTRCTIAAI